MTGTALCADGASKFERFGSGQVVCALYQDFLFAYRGSVGPRTVFLLIGEIGIEDRINEVDGNAIYSVLIANDRRSTEGELELCLSRIVCSRGRGQYPILSSGWFLTIISAVQLSAGTAGSLIRTCARCSGSRLWILFF